MNDQQLKDLLIHGDQAAGDPGAVQIDRSFIRQRARLRREMRRVGGATVVIFIAAALWITIWGGGEQILSEESRMAKLETDLAQLQADTETLLASVDRLLKHQEQQTALQRVQLRLNDIPEPREHAEALINRAAFVLIDQADLLVQESKQRMTARRLYQQVIKLYPNTDAAQTAQKRLKMLKYQQTEEIDQGVELWQNKDTLSSC